MSEQTNVLYFVVMPQISLSLPDEGRVSQFLTLLPEPTFATEFSKDEVAGYILLFKNRERHLIGGSVVRYECMKQEVGNGRFTVRGVAICPLSRAAAECTPTISEGSVFTIAEFKNVLSIYQQTHKKPGIEMGQKSSLCCPVSLP